LLELARRVSKEPTLPGLTGLAEEDRASWDMFTARLADVRSNWDWRRRDSRREAALGLASHCDATELYSSLRLGDPLVASRESFAGSVVCGVVTTVAARVVEVTADQLACRLREQTAVEAFPGRPMNLPPALTSSPLVRVSTYGPPPGRARRPARRSGERRQPPGGRGSGSGSNARAAARPAGSRDTSGAPDSGAPPRSADAWKRMPSKNMMSWSLKKKTGSMDGRPLPS
jgi:hypothetical protein